MLSLPWKKHNATLDICDLGQFRFKRRHITGVEEYEIWQAGKLEFKTFKYGEFSKRVHVIIESKLKGRQI